MMIKSVSHKYNHIFDCILTQMSDEHYANTGLTNNEDIRKILNHYFDEDVYSVNDNLDLSKPVSVFDRLVDMKQPIGHWNLSMVLKPDLVFIYDPFGVPFYTNEFNNKTIIYSLDQDQRLNSTSCGLYCIKKLFEVLFNHHLCNSYLIVNYRDNTYEVHIDGKYSKSRLTKYIKTYKLIHQKSNIDLNK